MTLEAKSIRKEGVRKVTLGIVMFLLVNGNDPIPNETMVVHNTFLTLTFLEDIVVSLDHLKFELFKSQD